MGGFRLVQVGFRLSWACGYGFGFRSAQVGFRLLWASVGPLVLVGGRGFARHGQPRVLGLVVVAENGSNLVFIFYFLFFIFYYHLSLWV